MLQRSDEQRRPRRLKLSLGFQQDPLSRPVRVRRLHELDRVVLISPKHNLASPAVVLLPNRHPLLKIKDSQPAPRWLRDVRVDLHAESAEKRRQVDLLRHAAVGRHQISVQRRPVPGQPAALSPVVRPDAVLRHVDGAVGVKRARLVARDSPKYRVQLLRRGRSSCSRCASRQQRHEGCQQNIHNSIARGG